VGLGDVAFHVEVTKLVIHLRAVLVDGGREEATGRRRESGNFLEAAQTSDGRTALGVNGGGGRQQHGRHEQHRDANLSHCLLLGKGP
jgi:hypothetical protein